MSFQVADRYARLAKANGDKVYVNYDNIHRTFYLTNFEEVYSRLCDRVPALPYIINGVAM